MTPDLMEGGAEFLPFYNFLQIQKRTVIHNFTQPYYATEMWFLDVDAGQKCRIIQNLFYSTNILRLVKLNRDVFTGGESNIGRKQKKFRILGRYTLMEEITGTL